MSGAVALTDTDRRRRLHAGLERRNRVVGVLRVLVPLAGALAAAVVVAGLAIEAMSNRFGFANVRIDRNNLVVDTPQLSSILADGTAVALTASAARLDVGNVDRAELNDVAFSASLANGTTLRADAGLARLTLSTQRIEVPGATRVTSSSGFTGTATDVVADVQGLGIAATGGVVLGFGEGNRLTASDMAYDHKAGTFVFHNARLSLTSTPGD